MIDRMRVDARRPDTRRRRSVARLLLHRDGGTDWRARPFGFDRIVDASEAGLGGGLEAEEAQLGITDEEIAAELGEDDDE